MQPVVTADEMRALDRAAIDDLGIPGFTLMETAGRAVAAAALAMLPSPGGTVAVVCGPGNNGGDGFVAARVLRARNVTVGVWLAVPRAAIQGDALAHLEVYRASGGIVHDLSTSDDSPRAHATLLSTFESASLVVDALFGIGTLRPLTGHLARVIEAMNRAPRRLAVDIPSGLDADTGAIVGAAVLATRTVALGAYKVAHVSSPGFARCGEVEVAEIGIPIRGGSAGLVERADILEWLPVPRLLDHKGTRGHVLVVSGAPATRGAGRLAALGALRAGAGLVTLAGDGQVDAPDSVMTTTFHADDLKDVVVIGPGLGQSADARAKVEAVLASGVPAVLDADALNVVTPAVLAAARGPLVLTPHPGEAARLLGVRTPEIEGDRMAAVRALAHATRAVVVLKGARTLICDGARAHARATAPGGPVDTGSWSAFHAHEVPEAPFVAINPTGSPALATAGSGDVLAGVIGALLAQLREAHAPPATGGTQLAVVPAWAACVGSYLHGAAGAALATTHGRGVISSDLPDAIAREIATLDRER